MRDGYVQDDFATAESVKKNFKDTKWNTKMIDNIFVYHTKMIENITPAFLN